MAADSKKAVVAACLANAGIGVAKGVGFLVTGASSMLAEAVHSFADTGNQALLLLGSARAKRKENERHPFGYARERYFWAFVVALVIFVLGAVFAITEGTAKLHEPHELEAPAVAVGILGLSVLLEGWSFLTAVREAHKTKGILSWWAFIKHSKSAELPVVLLEDLGALLGLVLALGGVGLAQLTGDPRYDAVATIAIGVLLGAIAILLALEMHSLLIGESASDRHVALIEEAIVACDGVRTLIHMRTMHLGPDELLVGAKVEFAKDMSFPDVAHAIDEIETAIRSVVPTARRIYIEPDLYHKA